MLLACTGLDFDALSNLSMPIVSRSILPGVVNPISCRSSAHLMSIHSITVCENKTHYLRRLYREDETSGGLSGIGITDREKILFLALVITTNHHSKASLCN